MMDVLYWVGMALGALFVAWLLIYCWRDLASEARRPSKPRQKPMVRAGRAPGDWRWLWPF
jgi:hypothetical protein